MTDCNNDTFDFQELGRRKLQADFSGGHLSNEGGLLLISQLDQSLGITAQLAHCFADCRDQRYVEHSLPELLRQRIYGLVAGYEDLNDHESLRRDPLIAAAVGKTDPLGEGRVGEDKGNPLAGKSTLNRLEVTNAQTQNGDLTTHYHKIHAKHADIEKTLIQLSTQALPKDTNEIILDFDATDDLIHGQQQEGRYFHGYYRNYCYLPLYAFVGDLPFYARLRTCDRDGCDGTVEALESIVPQLRARFPQVRIIVRADSGFARETIMKWCEDHGCYYCLGMAKNARLQKLLEPAMIKARETACLTGGFACQFDSFHYQTVNSWSRQRRLIGKAQIIRGKENPRFVVTNLPEDHWPEGEPPTTEIADFSPESIYRHIYCARGDMENRIKEQQLDMFADRTSSAAMASNQLRLWFSTIAYLLVQQLRTHALKGTKLAKATVGTIRQRLLKVAASIRVSVRRVHVRLCSTFVLRELFEQAHERIGRLPAQS